MNMAKPETAAGGNTAHHKKHHHHNNHKKHTVQNGDHSNQSHHNKSQYVEPQVLSNDSFQVPIKRIESRERQLLAIGIKELIGNNAPQPVTLESNVSAEQALKTLSEQKILSAPVMGPNGKLMGLVDVMDIVKHCLNAYSEDTESEGPAEFTHWCRDADKVRAKAVRYALKPVHALIGISGNDPTCPVSSHGNVYQLAEVFALGVRRVPVLDDEEKLTHIVSQSSLVSYINNHRTLLAGVGHKTLEQLHFVPGPSLVSMHSKAPAIEACLLLLANRVSACAIVNGNNDLIGNLSASDLRDMSMEELPDLLLCCEEFLEKRQKNGQRSPLVTCTTKTTLEECVQTLDERHVHRVWVLDENKAPVGVVTVGDIARIMVKEDE